jgi:hypothetical protein
MLSILLGKQNGPSINDEVHEMDREIKRLKFNKRLKMLEDPKNVQDLIFREINETIRVQQTRPFELIHDDSCVVEGSERRFTPIDVRNYV